MEYLYHRVPNNMEGNILYPLNELKDIYPKAYEIHVQKYEGRPSLMKEQIPVLNCLWNDVLHMSSVDPREIKIELEKNNSEMRGLRFYKIDPFSLNPDKTIVYLYKEMVLSHVVVKEDFTAYDPSMIAEYSTLPEDTKKYYKDMIQNGERPLLWHRVPHILYKGSIDTTVLEIVIV